MPWTLGCGSKPEDAGEKVQDHGFVRASDHLEPSVR